MTRLRVLKRFDGTRQVSGEEELFDERGKSRKRGGARQPEKWEMGKQWMARKEKGDYVGNEIHKFEAKEMGTTVRSRAEKNNNLEPGVNIRQRKMTIKESRGEGKRNSEAICLAEVEGNRQRSIFLSAERSRHLNALWESKEGVFCRFFLS